MAVEFTFFTLADSGAFVTHVPKSLNEALALVRPFQWEVWFLFMFTILVSGPSIYCVIIAPSWWQKLSMQRQQRISLSSSSFNRVRLKRLQSQRRRKATKSMANGQTSLTVTSAMPVSLAYMKEMSYGMKNIPTLNRRYLQLNRDARRKMLPMNLFNKCIWFAITLFLRQCEFNTITSVKLFSFCFIFSLAFRFVSIENRFLFDCSGVCVCALSAETSACMPPYDGNRARFLSAILWLAATYVLGDVYSAQLTSQLARPAREPPISKHNFLCLFLFHFVIRDVCLLHFQLTSTFVSSFRFFHWHLFCSDTLHKLENAMRYRKYQLYVERQSASLGILEVIETSKSK